MSKVERIHYYPNLTGLRFFLALFVVIFHIAEFSRNRGFPYFNDLPIFHKGTEAVCMFFTLSGFLIIKQLYNEKNFTGTINIKAFYLRRMLRIFPLYYLVLIFGFLYYQYILPSLGFEFESNYNLWSGIFLSITFFANIFSTYSPGGILEILWSIGIEEQFYLLIVPILLLLQPKRVVLFLSAFTAIYFCIYFFPHITLLRKYKMLFYYFSFGGICSILIDQNHIQGFISKLRYPILISCVIYFTTALIKNNLGDLNYNLFSFLLFGFVISALSMQPISILSSKKVIYLGKVSYGIYMLHAIAMHFVGFVYLKYLSKYHFNYALNVAVINVAIIWLTILMSHLSFKYYESYFLRMKYRNEERDETD